MSADRASGAFFFLFGLVLLFLIIPNFVEEVEGGYIAPNSMPNALAMGLSFFGALLAIKPSAHRLRDHRYLVRALIFVLVLIAAIFTMSHAGFIVIAPVLALVIMLLIGERRPLWLVIGVAIVPATIWLLVTQLLDRALP